MRYVTCTKNNVHDMAAIQAVRVPTRLAVKHCYSTTSSSSILATSFTSLDHHVFM